MLLEGPALPTGPHLAHADRQALHAPALFLGGEQGVDPVVYGGAVAHHLGSGLVVVVDARAAARIPGDDVQQPPFGFLPGEWFPGQQELLGQPRHLAEKRARGAERLLIQGATAWVFPIR